jgi:hypothetical protein
MEQSKSLSRWRFDLQRGGKKAWAGFYQDFLGAQPSSYPRFYKAINNYGFWPMFDAIVESSDRELNGDPLNYVLKVAANKWKESEQEDENTEGYISDIEKAKEVNRQANDRLAEKIKKTNQTVTG